MCPSRSRFPGDNNTTDIGRWIVYLVPPAAVHYGRAQDIYEERARVLDEAYGRTPERFVSRPPRPPALPTAVWINKPDTKEGAH